LETAKEPGLAMVLAQAAQAQAQGLVLVLAELPTAHQPQHHAQRLLNAPSMSKRRAPQVVLWLASSSL
jgi:hypothetical protein